MKIIIVDDEPLARDRLRALINELNLGKVVAEASNGREALNAIRVHQPKIVLLDVRMPGMTGIQLIEQINLFSPTPAIIFTTAYADHALEAFEHQAVDYLLKPIRKDRLEKALKRAYTLTQTPSIGLSKPTARTHISAYMRGELRLVPVNQVYYFVANQKYVALHWSQGEVLISEALKDLEEEFAGQFLRIHRSILVGIVHISSLVKGNNGRSYIKLKVVDNLLEVSRRHLPKVKKNLKDMRIPNC